MTKMCRGKFAKEQATARKKARERERRRKEEIIPDNAVTFVIWSEREL